MEEIHATMDEAGSGLLPAFGSLLVPSGSLSVVASTQPVLRTVRAADTKAVLNHGGKQRFGEH